MRLLLTLLLLIPFSLHAQVLPDDGSNRVRIVENGLTLQAEIKPVENPPKIKSDRYYFWYSTNEIHSTQGGFSGKLLNGGYNAFYPSRNLKEQGNFKNGLKSGVWKSWKEDGTLIQSSNWKDGILIPEDKRTLWQKVNIFKKKKITAKAN